MRRRQFSGMLVTAGVSLLVRRGFAATTPSASESIKGKLIEHQDGPAVLRTDEGKMITLAGDEDTQKVLHDPRMDGLTIEAIGHATAPGQFTFEPRFEKNMYAF